MNYTFKIISHAAVILCSPLDVPVNGQIIYTTEHHSNHTVDTIATYSCNVGYALVGDNQRVCVDDDQLDTMGQWNGSAPLCESKVYSNIFIMHVLCYILHAVIVCSALDEPENGQITYDAESMTDFALDTIATHTCNEGFSLVGQFTRTCIDDDQADTMGVWSGSAPSCQGMNCVTNGLSGNYS